MPNNAFWNFAPWPDDTQRRKAWPHNAQWYTAARCFSNATVTTSSFGPGGPEGLAEDVSAAGLGRQLQPPGQVLPWLAGHVCGQRDVVAGVVLVLFGLQPGGQQSWQQGGEP